jgi:LysR family transcriptional regulator, hypochlorite-specific transcription factor HypT
MRTAESSCSKAQRMNIRRPTSCFGDLTSRLAAHIDDNGTGGTRRSVASANVAAEDRMQDQLVRPGPEHFDIPTEIRLFRSLDCGSQMADELWDHLATSRPLGAASDVRS